jgi:hypothetical protein
MAVTLTSTGITFSDSTSLNTAPATDSTAAGVRAVFVYNNASNYPGNYQVRISSLGTPSSATASAGGTARNTAASSNYGSSKLGVMFGGINYNTRYNTVTLFNSSGDAASESSGVGTARGTLGGMAYSSDKCVFAGGYDNSNTYAVANFLSNTGVLAADYSISNFSASYQRAGSNFGTGTSTQGICGFFGSGYYNNTTVNYVSTAGVFSSEYNLANGGNRGNCTGTMYGTDKCMFWGGSEQGGWYNNSILISNTGAFAGNSSGADFSGNGSTLAAAPYGTAQSNAIIGTYFKDYAFGYNQLQHMYFTYYAKYNSSAVVIDNLRTLETIFMNNFPGNFYY